MLLTVFYPCLKFVCCMGEYGLWLFIIFQRLLVVETMCPLFFYLYIVICCKGEMMYLFCL